MAQAIIKRGGLPFPRTLTISADSVICTPRNRRTSCDYKVHGKEYFEQGGFITLRLIMMLRIRAITGKSL